MAINLSEIQVQLKLSPNHFTFPGLHAVVSYKIDTKNLCVIKFYILTVSFLYLIKIEIVCALHAKWTNSFKLKIKHDGYYQFNFLETLRQFISVTKALDL